MNLPNALSLTLIVLASAAHAADMPGSSDHPLIPRVTGAEILGYEQSNYDAGNFLLADADKKLKATKPEGIRTRILYLTRPGDKPLMVQRNYQVALDELGSVKEIYACKPGDCSDHQMSTNLWTKDSMIPTEGLNQPFYLLGFAHNFNNSSYRYTEVRTEDALLHVGVFAAELAANNANSDLRDRTVALIEILQIENFQPTLEFVDAAAMQSEINTAGHVALYGIQFDHDKATLTPESAATLQEIVRALQADADLSLYVVGHSDDVGDLAYNQALSQRRAQTVVDALTAAGIPAGRLTALGVGPAAPIGSNDSEEGRTLNRRVELVKRTAS